MPRVIIASPHCYPDLARLWYRTLTRELVPALQQAHLDVEVIIYRDANAQRFDPQHFPGAGLEVPHARARDFLRILRRSFSP